MLGSYQSNTTILSTDQINMDTKITLTKLKSSAKKVPEEEVKKPTANAKASKKAVVEEELSP